MDSMEEIFGKPISVYTRAMALADGMLVDVSETSRETGIRWPVCVTRALWHVIETIPPRTCEDREGRLWDVLWMAYIAMRAAKPGSYRIAYELILTRAGTRKKYQTLVVDVGPGDEGEPQITIGFAEDF